MGRSRDLVKRYLGLGITLASPFPSLRQLECLPFYKPPHIWAELLANNFLGLFGHLIDNLA